MWSPAPGRRPTGGPRPTGRRSTTRHPRARTCRHRRPTRAAAAGRSGRTWRWRGTARSTGSRPRSARGRRAGRAIRVVPTSCSPRAVVAASLDGARRSPLPIGARPYCWHGRALLPGRAGFEPRAGDLPLRPSVAGSALGATTGTPCCRRPGTDEGDDAAPARAPRRSGRAGPQHRRRAVRRTGPPAAGPGHRGRHPPLRRPARGAGRAGDPPRGHGPRGLGGPPVRPHGGRVPRPPPRGRGVDLRTGRPFRYPLWDLLRRPGR